MWVNLWIQNHVLLLEKNRAFRDILTSSHFSPGGSCDPCASHPKGTFKCGCCDYCQFIREIKEFTLPNSENDQPKHVINCNIIGVVYLLTCDCGSHYVGKTKRTFWKRMSYPVSDITTRILDKSPVARHFAERHKSEIESLKYTVLARIHPHRKLEALIV